jgi:hypothetical protein
MPPKIAKPIYNGDEWNDDDVMMMMLAMDFDDDVPA